MKYAILLGISVVGYDAKIGAIATAISISEANPTRKVRVIDTHTDEIVRVFRNGALEEL